MRQPPLPVVAGAASPSLLPTLLIDCQIAVKLETSCFLWLEQPIEPAAHASNSTFRKLWFIITAIKRRWSKAPYATSQITGAYPDNTTNYEFTLSAGIPQFEGAAIFQKGLVSDQLAEPTPQRFFFCLRETSLLPTGTNDSACRKFHALNATARIRLHLGAARLLAFLEATPKSVFRAELNEHRISMLFREFPASAIQRLPFFNLIADYGRSHEIRESSNGSMVTKRSSSQRADDSRQTICHLLLRSFKQLHLQQKSDDKTAAAQLRANCDETNSRQSDAAPLLLRIKPALAADAHVRRRTAARRNSRDNFHSTRPITISDMSTPPLTFSGSTVGQNQAQSKSNHEAALRVPSKKVAAPRWPLRNLGRKEPVPFARCSNISSDSNWRIDIDTTSSICGRNIILYSTLHHGRNVERRASTPQILVRNYAKGSLQMEQPLE